MKKAKKALLVSVFALVFAVAIATTSTLAWFAMSNDPEVDEFELTVTTNENLYIASAKEGNYGFDLSYADFVNTAYVASTDTAVVANRTYYTKAGDVYTAVATPTGNPSASNYYVRAFADLALDACTPVLTGGAATATAGAMTLNDIKGTAAAAGSYYKLDLHFLSTQEFWISANYTKTLATNLVKSARKAQSPIALESTDLTTAGETGAAVAVGGAIDAYAVNAVRIAFVSGTNVVLYNPNSAAASWSSLTASKGNMAQLIYQKEMNTTIDVTEASNTVAAKGGNSVSILQLKTIGEDATLRNKATGLGIDATENVYYGTMSVYVWLEGKDADCFASIYKDVMKIALAFESTTAQVNA